MVEKAEKGLPGMADLHYKEPTMEVFDRLKALVAETEADVIKAEKGNRAAGTRIRKAMQDIKKTAQDVRVEVLQMRSSEEPPPMGGPPRL